jgi:probable HAF family extracellular repeat protein
MKNMASPAFVRCSALLMLSLSGAGAWACGTGSTTVTNVPSLGGSSQYIYALGSGGHITGYSFTSGDAAYDAFLYGPGFLTDLGTLGGLTSIGYAVNRSGQVAGQADLADGTTHAFLFSAGKLVDLGTLGGTFSTAAAMNDAGQVVGNSTLDGDSVTAAFLFSNGTMTNLGLLGGDYSAAFAINNSGVIVGQSTTTNSDYHGFIYANGKMTDMGTLGGDYSTAVALNDDGVAVGQSTTASSDSHGFVYANGVMTDVGTLGGSHSSAFLINSNGLVAGMAGTLNDAQTHGFLYSGGTMTDLGDLGGGYSAPNAMNNAGVIVGSSATANGTYHAFIVRNGQMTDLNTLLPDNSGWELGSAVAINYGLYYGAFDWFVMDLGSANQAPIAIAGPDQTLDCTSQVTLDASKSSDPDNDSLSYEWSVGGTVLGTSVSLATSLPLGTNVVTLKVTDPCGASSTATLLVTVVAVNATGAHPKPTRRHDVGNRPIYHQCYCQRRFRKHLKQRCVPDNCGHHSPFICEHAGSNHTLRWRKLSGARAQCALRRCSHR